jgi:hypothetical protein
MTDRSLSDRGAVTAKEYFADGRGTHWTHVSSRFCETNGSFFLANLRHSRVCARSDISTLRERLRWGRARARSDHWAYPRFPLLRARPGALIARLRETGVGARRDLVCCQVQHAIVAYLEGCPVVAVELIPRPPEGEGLVMMRAVGEALSASEADGAAELLSRLSRLAQGVRYLAIGVPLVPSFSQHIILTFFLSSKELIFLTF